MTKKKNNPIGEKGIVITRQYKKKHVKWAINIYPKILTPTQNKINLKQNEMSISHFLPSYIYVFIPARGQNCMKS